MKMSHKEWTQFLSWIAVALLVIVFIALVRIADLLTYILDQLT